MKLICGFLLTSFLVSFGCSSVEPRLKSVADNSVEIVTEKIPSHSKGVAGRLSKVNWNILVGEGSVIQDLVIMAYPKAIRGKIREIRPEKVQFSSTSSNEKPVNAGTIHTVEILSNGIKLSPLKAKVTLYNANCGAEESICKSKTQTQLVIESSETEILF